MCGHGNNEVDHSQPRCCATRTNRDADDKSVETSKHAFSPEGKMQHVMTIMEVALSLSKSKNEEDLVHVLEQAMSMNKQLDKEMNDSTPNERTNKRTRTAQLT